MIIRKFLNKLGSHVERGSFDGGEHDGVGGHGSGKTEIA